MSRAEKFISDCTMNGSNQIINGNYGTIIPHFTPWLTPDEARRDVEIAREEVIDKAVGWIEEIYNHHYIMRYSDSCEPPLIELTEWFRNYMERE